MNPKKFDRNIIILVLICSFFFMNHFFPSIYFPFEANKMGISKIIIGLIFSLYPAGSLIIGVFLSKNMNFYNKKILIAIFQSINIFSSILFGSLSLIKNYYIFILIASSARIIQGIGIIILKI